MGEVTVSRSDLCVAAIVWSSIAQSQLGRFADSLGNSQAFELDATFYRQWESDGRPAEWRDYVSEMGRPGVQGDWWMLTAEYHFALLSLAHAVKAVDGLNDPAVPQFEESGLLLLLRNYHEHWEDPDGRSGSTLRNVRPEFKGEAIQFTKKWFVFHGISDSDLVRWLRTVGDSARAVLESEGGSYPHWGDVLIPTPRDTTWLGSQSSEVDE